MLSTSSKSAGASKDTFIPWVGRWPFFICSCFDSDTVNLESAIYHGSRSSIRRKAEQNDWPLVAAC